MSTFVTHTMATTRRRLALAVSLALLVSLTSISGQGRPTTALPRSTPEQEGVSSAGIMAFLDAAAALKGLELHNFMFLRHGKVIAEGSWSPYRPSLVHTLNSCSKIFTSTAVGFAVSEHLLTLDDKVISFFPNDLPDTISPELARMTVRDLMTMSSGVATEPNWIRATDNWVKGYLSTPVAHIPGTRFQYSSLGSYMVGAIVTKATGKDLLDYLEPRLFQPLGIEGAEWDTDSQGVSTGGSGMRVKIEDMAKLGQLYLQKGQWNGRQLLPAAWVAEATTAHIDQAPQADRAVKEKSDWMQGYGYQFWRCRHNAFRGDGSGGQFIVVMPDQDAVVVLQAEIADMQAELNLVWDHLLPAVKSGTVAAGPGAADLQRRLSSLALPLPPRGPEPALASSISGKTFTFESNEMRLEAMTLSFIDGLCHVTIRTGGQEHKLFFGAGKWIAGDTALPKSNLLQPAKTTGGGYVRQPDRSLKFRDDGRMLQKVAGSYSWDDASTLALVLRYIESPSGGRILCSFDGRTITVSVSFSNDTRASRAVVGQMH